MSVKYALLGLLAETPKHGYDIKRAFEERVGDFWPLNYGQIYTTLERLRDDGLVEYEAITQEDKPDKKVFRLTESGRTEFEDWRTSPIKAEPRTLRDELFLKLMFIDRATVDSLLALIQGQQSVYMAQMMQLTNRKYQIQQAAQAALNRATDPAARAVIERDMLVNVTLLDAALFHAEADIRWLRHSEARIREMYGK